MSSSFPPRMQGLLQEMASLMSDSDGISRIDPGSKHYMTDFHMVADQSPGQSELDGLMITKTFWEGRAFRVLLVMQPQPREESNTVVWIHGIVESWVNNIGILALNAELQPADSVAVGALVEDPSPDASNRRFDRGPGVVINMDENKEYCQVKLTLGHGTIKAKVEDLHLWGGPVEFAVKRMNVQGGGIVLPTRPDIETNNSRGTRMSLEWLEPVPEDWYCNVESAGRFRTETPNVEMGFVRKLREQTIVMMNAMQNPVPILLALIKEHPTKISSIMYGCPFLLYDQFTRDFVKDLEKKDAQLAKLVLEIGIALRCDEAWIRETLDRSKIGDNFPNVEHVPAADHKEYLVRRSYQNFLGCMSDGYFERVLEFRAAIWVLELAMESNETSPVRIPVEERNWFTANFLIALGDCKYRMGNIVAGNMDHEKAIRMQEGAIDNSMCAGAATTSTRRFRRVWRDDTLLRNKKEVMYWKGTSGTMPPWLTLTPHVPDKMCPVCNKKAKKKCAACHLICYCSAECQVKDWKAAHKKCCLGICKRN
ncbi:MAG: hypothetical protein SGILL_008162 [Bacillariaceae sp.]